MQTIDIIFISNCQFIPCPSLHLLCKTQLAYHIPEKIGELNPISVLEAL